MVREEKPPLIVFAFLQYLTNFIYYKNLYIVAATDDSTSQTHLQVKYPNSLKTKRGQIVTLTFMN